MRSFVFILSLILGVSSCKKEIINEIPETCYNQSYANFRVNGVDQEVTLDLFEGINLNYSYSAKPTGEWSIGLENDAHIISMTVFGFLSDEEYNQLSKEGWISKIESEGSYNLVQSSFLQQVIYHSLSDSVVFTNEHLVDGTVQMEYENKGGCDFMKIDYVLVFSNDSLAKWVDGTVYSAIPLKFEE